MIPLGDTAVGGTSGWTGDDGIPLGGDITGDIGGCRVGDGVPLWGRKLEDTSGFWVGNGGPLGDGTAGAITTGPWFKLNTDGWEFLTCHDGLLNAEDCNAGDVIPLGKGKVDLTTGR